MSRLTEKRVLVAAKGADQYMVRLPDGMRDQVAALSKSNGRSMNTEIIIAIEKHLSSNGVEVPQLQPTGHDPRLDTFVAAALSGLLARMDDKDAIDAVCGEARMIGSYMLECMEEMEREDAE